MEVYRVLADPEGWGMRPWEIARLTDWQIEWLYLKPARDRGRERQGLPPEPEPAGPRTREGYIRAARHLFGGTADHWGRKWDEAHHGRTE